MRTRRSPEATEDNTAGRATATRVTDPQSPNSGEVGGRPGVPSMTDSSEVKSSIQLDGGEGLAERKGVVARRGLKEAWSKTAARWTRIRYETYPVGRAAWNREVRVLVPTVNFLQ